MTITQTTESASGTCLQGYVTTTYDRLVALFGEPTYSDPSGEDKVQYEWTLKTPAGIATVYDWKNYGIDARNVTNWHVGGFDKSVVAPITAALAAPSAESDVLDELAHLLSAEEWPGASGMEDVAELVGRVRDITTVPGREWYRH